MIFYEQLSPLRAAGKNIADIRWRWFASLAGAV